MRLWHAIFETLHGLRHRWQSRIRHGVHSPFVFALQDGVLKDAAMSRLEAVEQRRTALLQDERSFQRRDWGAGSRRGHSDQQSTTIGRFARRSLQHEHPARILRGIADAVNASNVLELGTALGITTAYLAWERSARNVVTIEGDPFVLETARAQWSALALNNVTSICDNFDQALERPTLNTRLWDMVVVDGNHTYDATMRYWGILKNKISERGCIVLDDIYWSPDMLRAWREIAADEAVSLTLDYFDFGVVFMFPRPQKEHYILRMPTSAPRTRYV
jgi:predicted O-methyltransferase YrrM